MFTKKAQILRGDSFQILFEDSLETLNRSIQLRCWLKSSHLIGKGTLDARVAIGVGAIACYGESVAWTIDSFLNII